MQNSTSSEHLGFKNHSNQSRKPLPKSPKNYSNISLTGKCLPFFSLPKFSSIQLILSSPNAYNDFQIRSHLHANQGVSQLIASV
jgi:hypothetical protein